MSGNKVDIHDFSINPSAPLFVISVVSAMTNIPVWTLRKIDEYGLVVPERLGTRTRCYSQIQIKQLAKIRFLMVEKGVSIGHLRVFLEMDDKS